MSRARHFSRSLPARVSSAASHDLSDDRVPRRSASCWPGRRRAASGLSSLPKALYEVTDFGGRVTTPSSSAPVDVLSEPMGILSYARHRTDVCELSRDGAAGTGLDAGCGLLVVHAPWKRPVVWEAEVHLIYLFAILRLPRLRLQSSARRAEKGVGTPVDYVEQWACACACMVKACVGD